jgi:uncharacterized glyoxalase superfamily metalloenzyme YdcJ
MTATPASTSLSSAPGRTDAGRFANKIDMQNRLFAELSRMFGTEVPLYDKSLLVNQECNKAVCAIVGQLYPGFAMSTEELDKTSSERHGAIRIGRPDEYRLIARFFAAFAMEPHNYYDMSNVGAKSQPIVATAFRSMYRPEHRVFSSLLQTDYFDPATKARIEELLATRTVFSAKAKELLEKNERQGGLSWDDANALIREGTERIFKWTGKARDFQLYNDLCNSGFKIAADIACFESHHLNHLTPNTFCMDLYTAAMKFCLGEWTEATFRQRATRSLERLARQADRHWMKLHFKHLSADAIDAFPHGALAPSAIATTVDALATRLAQTDLQLKSLNHSGFKDFTEGPAEDTHVLLRQDAYKALTEPVQFANRDGTTVDAKHTARFGEIEQRFYATTKKGRELYDRCLAAADAEKDADPSLIRRDMDAYERMYAAHFAEFPKSLPDLLKAGLVYGRFHATRAGIAAKGAASNVELWALVAAGHVSFEGLRYEDFLPVSAAGIFASNLNQYGTKSTAAVKPTYAQSTLESVIGKTIVDADAVYRAMEAESLLETYRDLGLLERVPAATRSEWEASVAAGRAQEAGRSARG